VKKLNALVRYGSACLLATILCGPVVKAQNSNTGEIKGSVTDPSGATVPGVSVAVKNVDTGVVTSATSNQAGLYDVPFLIPGSYSITFSKQGFKDLVRSGIALQVETVEISVALAIGTASEYVEVSAAGPLVETATSMWT
jgi:carboxypeptidase family protein